MRLWHQDLISKLPRQQLLGQHRECCALRGKGQVRPHATVNYVFNYSPNHLVAYHALVMDEMQRRGYHPDKIWYDFQWRGKILNFHEGWTDSSEVCRLWENAQKGIKIYQEHNDAYYQECIDNLKSKGIIIE